MQPDERSFRIALTADRYMIPPAGGLDGLAVLAEAGWGVIQLPAEDYPAPVAERILAEVADQVREFHSHGYELVVVGESGQLGGARAGGGGALPRPGIPPRPGPPRACLPPPPRPAAPR